MLLRKSHAFAQVNGSNKMFASAIGVIRSADPGIVENTVHLLRLEPVGKHAERFCIETVFLNLQGCQNVIDLT